jgi:Transposase
MSSNNPAEGASLSPEAPTTMFLPGRCAPKNAPCPRCGTPGVRKRTCNRTVRTVAYKAIAFLKITYGEYPARGAGCTPFRTTPDDVLPKAKYDNRVRDRVRERLLDDGMSIERAWASIRREFLRDRSPGLVYDVLRGRAEPLDLAAHRRLVLEHFSGPLCVDELHRGRFTLLLATAPISDLPGAFALVSAHDQDHMRRFLQDLKTWGLEPKAVLTDGADLYPRVRGELWPDADHQRCVFHIIKDIHELILDAVRRLRGRRARRGRAGRRKTRGRPKRRAKAAARRRGWTLKQRAPFVFKQRHLIVKRRENFTQPDRADLVRMREYLPEWAVWRRFADRMDWLVDTPKDFHQASCRRRAIEREGAFRAVPELVQALEKLGPGKFAKMMAYLNKPVSRRVRTNHQVERTNRLIRWLEEVRYKGRRRKTRVRFVVRMLDRFWREWTPRETKGGDRRESVRSGTMQAQQQQRRRVA